MKPPLNLCSNNHIDGKVHFAIKPTDKCIDCLVIGGSTKGNWYISYEVFKKFKLRKELKVLKGGKL